LLFPMMWGTAQYETRTLGGVRGSPPGLTWRLPTRLYAGIIQYVM
jgi:hypothetical protein